MSFIDDFYALVRTCELSFFDVRGGLVYTETALYQRAYERGGNATAEEYLCTQRERTRALGKTMTINHLRMALAPPARRNKERANEFAGYFFSFLDDHAHIPIIQVIDATPVIGGELYRILLERGGVMTADGYIDDMFEAARHGARTRFPRGWWQTALKRVD